MIPKHATDSPRAIAERRRSNRMVWAFGVLLALFVLWEVWHDLFE